LELIANERFPSFVSVLKFFGKGENGPLAFPMEGYMLALDFPITDRLFGFLDRLDQIVVDCGGRIYLTKDSRMKPEILQKGYPRLPEFLRIKQQIDSGKVMQSLQSKRLGV
jgi:FAD/FMN-containing dehydrogenase